MSATRKFSSIISLSATLALATSCASVARNDNLSPESGEAGAIKVTSIGDSTPTFDQLPEESAQAIREVEREIIEADSELIEDAKNEEATNAPATSKSASAHKIPIEINQNVRRWIHFFTVKDRERFQRFLDRGEKYKPMILGILKEHGIPKDLYYLALIESGFVLHAQSHASAVGAWQFIRGTGVRYGLEQNQYVDERKDIIHSTHAAAKYLKNLYTAFQSWYLAMASYNAGEGRILGAILRGGSRDFWDLVEKKALPSETRNYVPKFLAAMLIGKHPEKYGFKVPKADPYPQVDRAEIPGGVGLAEVSRRAHIPLEDLKEINPHLTRMITPTHAKTYPIWVPKGTKEQVAAIVPQLTRVKAPSAKARTVASTPSRHHHVKRGETLAMIARKYGLSVSQLKAANGLRSNRVAAGRKLVVDSSSSNSSNSRRTPRAPTHHRVRRGDALTMIAERYNVSVSKLKRLNDLTSSHIQVGQKLRLRNEI